MISKTDSNYIFSDNSGKWTAKHPLDGIDGPLSLAYKNDVLVTDCSGYIGSSKEEQAVVIKNNEYHKASESIIETHGYVANGDARAEYKHTYKYSNRRLKVTSDVHFSRDFKIHRHFSLGSLFLPGKWQSFSVIPAAFHQANNALPYTREIAKYDNSPLMLGHWHRPPLAMTFFRPNGTAIEIGTGSDLWRWEENLGHSPESGSFKIIHEENGIRIIREPLACCDDHIPENRAYKFSWYLAWRENGAKKKLPHHHAVDLTFPENGEFNRNDLIEQIKNKEYFVYAVVDCNKLIKGKTDQLRVKSPYDFIRGIHSDSACWSNKSILTSAKKVIRKLTELDGLDGIIFKNFIPDYCYHASHVNKKHPNGTAHWDVNALFDFASWATNQCPEEFILHVDNDDSRPSISGLFE